MLTMLASQSGRGTKSTVMQSPPSTGGLGPSPFEFRIFLMVLSFQVHIWSVWLLCWGSSRNETLKNLTIFQIFCKAYNVWLSCRWNKSRSAEGGLLMVFELRGGENTRKITENVEKSSQAFNFSRKNLFNYFLLYTAFYQNGQKVLKLQISWLSKIVNGY